MSSKKKEKTHEQNPHTKTRREKKSKREREKYKNLAKETSSGGRESLRLGANLPFFMIVFMNTERLNKEKYNNIEININLTIHKHKH